MTGYGQFCPVSKASEILCQRWTILVVRELLAGSTRFSDIQRGMVTCPPATLSKRLKELVRAGIVERVEVDRDVSYRLTRAGDELRPIVFGLGTWAQQWARSDYGPDDLDADLLLWDIRRSLRPDGLGTARAVVQMDLREPSGRLRCFWIVVEPREVDLCVVDPQRPVDVVVSAELRALTEVWMGEATFAAMAERGRILVEGDPHIAHRLPGWIGVDPVFGQLALTESASETLPPGTKC